MVICILSYEKRELQTRKPQEGLIDLIDHCRPEGSIWPNVHCLLSSSQEPSKCLLALELYFLLDLTSRHFKLGNRATQFLKFLIRAERKE